MSKKITKLKFIHLSIIISFLCTNNLHGQQLKTYKGILNKGSATYTYYEDDEFNRILQGEFTYIGPLFDVKGQFTKGKENGKWNILATNKVHENIGAKFQINTAITGNFVNGNFEGLWSYSNSMRLWDYYSKKYDTNYDKETSTANFKNNNFIGKITYASNWPNITKVEGYFTDSGLLNGTWLIESGNKKHIIKYLNGIAYWRLSQDESTGEKQAFYDSTTFVNTFWQNYDSLTNISIINGKNYSPKKIQLLSTHSTEGVINSDYSYYKELENPAIKLWTWESIALFNNQAVANPLYFYKRDFKQLPFNPPTCYEIIIEEKW